MYAGPPTSSSSPARFNSSFSVTRSIASPRSASLTILSKIRRCASRKKSPESTTSAARLNASLCGSIRSATATSGIGSCWGGGRERVSNKTAGEILLPARFCLRADDQNGRRSGSRAFGNDVHLDAGVDVAVQLHRNIDITELLD